MSRTQLYRHFDKDGTLLYVGISLSVVGRLAQHATSPWFSEIASITVEHFDTRKLAVAAEKRAIRKEGPKHNKAHAKLNLAMCEVLINRVQREHNEGKHKYVVPYLDTHGRQRAYFRIKGAPLIPMVAQLGSEMFFTEYAKLRREHDPEYAHACARSSAANLKALQKTHDCEWLRDENGEITGFSAKPKVSAS